MQQRQRQVGAQRAACAVLCVLWLCGPQRGLRLITFRRLCFPPWPPSPPAHIPPPHLFCENSRFPLLLPCQVGAALLELYGGLAANLVRAAGQSAVQLVRLVTAAFPGFRDHCVYRCGQLLLCAVLWRAALRCWGYAALRPISLPPACAAALRSINRLCAGRLAGP